MTTFTEKVAIANNAFSINIAALTKLVNSGIFYDFADKKTMYMVSNRKQLVAAMFAACDAGKLSVAENIELQTVTKGYHVEMLIVAAKAIKTEVVPVVSPVVDRVAELEAALLVKTQECSNLTHALNDSNKELANANVKINQYESIFARLQKRTVVIGKTLTKVFVESRVESKSTFS